ncbi:MAG: hypothetical protein U9Q76_05030, partial [candidate division WOR-3 bacterium]|nr:hypothetical protein [candidate division WOR-3 bacterium]
ATGEVSYPDMPNAGHFDIEEARTYAENIGSHWGLMNIWSLSAVQLLFMVEYGSMHSQTLLGRGIVDKASGSDFAGENTGAFNIDDHLGHNGTGRGYGADDGLVPICYRWIENLWGNTWSFIDGYAAVDAAYRILKADGSATNFGESGWGVNDYDTSTATPITSDGYISNIEHEALLKYMLIPAAVAGSTSTYIPDYFWAHDAGETNILLAGGYWGIGSKAGLGCLNSRHDVAYSYRLIAARLEFMG